MSLYNQLFGYSPIGGEVLYLILGKPDAEEGMGGIPRFRDAFIDDEKKLVIYTRTGGGNRDSFQDGNNFLRSLPGFIDDQDDPFDETYAFWRYEPNEVDLEIVEEMYKKQGHYNPSERFQSLLEAMKRGEETPEVQHALEVGKPILESIKKGIEENQSGFVMLDKDHPAMKKSE